jgi:hypothetical protein
MPALVRTSKTPREIDSPRCFGDFKTFMVRYELIIKVVIKPIRMIASVNKT